MRQVREAPSTQVQRETVELGPLPSTTTAGTVLSTDASGVDACVVWVARVEPLKSALGKESPTMNKLIPSLVAALGVVAATAGVVQAASNSPAVTVTTLTVFRDGHADVAFSAGLNCGGSTTNVATISAGVNSANAEGVKAILSTLQAAKLSGAKVVVHGDGLNTWGLCNIYSVDLL